MASTCTSHAQIIKIGESILPTLPSHRWVQRLLAWHPLGARLVGRPRHTFESKFGAYCRYTNIGAWREAALDEML